MVKLHPDVAIRNDTPHLAELLHIPWSPPRKRLSADSGRSYMVWLKSSWDVQWSTQVESVQPHLSVSSYCKKVRKSTLATFIFLCAGKDCMCACSRAGGGIHKRLNSYRHNYLLKEKPRKSPLHLKCTQFVMIPRLYKSCSTAFCCSWKYHLLHK